MIARLVEGIRSGEVGSMRIGNVCYSYEDLVREVERRTEVGDELVLLDMKLEEM